MAGLRWTVAQYRAFRARAKNPEQLPEVPEQEKSPPQKLLFEAMEAWWPGRFRYEVENLIPGRRFKADIADSQSLLLVELDGYRHHGLSLRGFTNDRERDYVFGLRGWVILRIPAGLVIKDLPAAMERVQTFVAAHDERRLRGTTSPVG